MKKKVLFIFALLCAVAQGAWADGDFHGMANINEGPVTVLASTPLTVTGTGAETSNTITLEDGATLTLGDGVNISSETSCITCEGNATIILGKVGSVTLTSTGENRPAIMVGPSGKTLTIKGEGTLSAQGGYNSAGIGGGYYHRPYLICGTIVIEGGVITATGGFGGAGIGVDANSCCDGITISGGTVTATGGKYSAGIGAGNIGTSPGNITISGGIVTATGGDGAAGIGAGYYVGYNGTCGNITISGGIVTATGGSNSAGIGGGKKTNCKDITITNGVTRVTAIKGTGAPYCIGKGCDEGSNPSTCGTVTIGDIVYYDGSACQNNGEDYIGRDELNIACVNNGTVSVNDSEYWLVMGNGEPTTNLIYLEGTSTVTLSNVNISSEGWCMFCNGNATIILKDGTTNTLTSTGTGSAGYPALWVGNRTTGRDVTITGETAGTGVLVAQGGQNCAGIGGGSHNDDGCCGNITIQGGIITATGGQYGAGIGSDKERSCYDITISGGTVTATGGEGSAGIGAGVAATFAGVALHCNNITISGGTVTATGGEGSAGIGAGVGEKGTCGTITITDGVTKLIAKKGSDANYSHCIGRSYDSSSHYHSSCGTVTINGVEYWKNNAIQNDGYYIEQDVLAFLKGNEGATGQYWTTFYYDTNNFEASIGTQVFKAGLNGTELTLTPISDRVIKSGEGVILKSSSHHFLLASAEWSSDDSYEDNVLTGTMTAITNPGNAYVLNKKTAGVGFYKLSDTGTIGAHKAYLVSTSGAREFFGFDEATGISSLTPDPSPNGEGSECYDLQGRKVAQPSKGLYIKDGKKYIKM